MSCNFRHLNEKKERADPLTHRAILQPEERMHLTNEKKIDNFIQSVPTPPISTQIEEKKRLKKMQAEKENKKPSKTM